MGEIDQFLAIWRDAEGADTDRVALGCHTSHQILGVRRRQIVAQVQFLCDLGPEGDGYALPETTLILPGKRRRAEHGDAQTRLGGVTGRGG